MPCLGSETNQANCSREALGGGGTVGGSGHVSSGAQSSDGGRRQLATLLHFSLMSVLQYMCIAPAFSSVSFHSFANRRFSVFSFQFSVFGFASFHFPETACFHEVLRRSTVNSSEMIFLPIHGGSNGRGVSFLLDTGGRLFRHLRAMVSDYG